MAKAKRLGDESGDKPKAKKVKFDPAEEAPDYESSQSEELSPSESEDDMGDLATEEIDNGIFSVLETIRNNPEKLKDQTLKFYPDVDETAPSKRKKEKPMYLKDYQRETLLNGDKEDDKIMYNAEQGKHKAELLAELNKSDGDADEDEEFLQKRVEQRPIPEVALPDPEKDQKAFLEAFLSRKAWIPKDVDENGQQTLPTYSQVLQEDDEEFDDRAEQFETAFNFRYEDADAANIVSFARDQPSMRRKKETPRQRAREKKRQEKEKEEEQRKLEIAKLRKTKVNEVADKLQELAKVLGDPDVSSRFSKEDLEGDWNNDEWDKRMQKLFDEEFYAKADSEWQPEHQPSDEPAPEKSEPSKKSKKDKKKKKELPLEEMDTKDIKHKAQEFVDANTDLLLDETIKAPTSFRYREVEPESFHLTARDILLADDKQLNRYVGLKRLAAYRDQTKVAFDRKLYSKKRRLREWRKQTFGSNDVDTEQLWQALKNEEGATSKHFKRK